MKGSNPPMNAPVPANITPKPTSQKQGVPIQKSIIFFIRILPVFLARVRPASHKAKPACMKNTMNAATNVQVTSAELYIRITPFCPRKPKKRRADFSARRLCRLFRWAYATTAAGPGQGDFALLPFFGALPVRRQTFSTVFGQDAEAKLYFLLRSALPSRPYMAYSLFF